MTITSRVTVVLKARLQERATQSGHKLSTAIAELLELALDLEAKLKPFRPAIERLVRDEHLTPVDALMHLLWMGVELNPTDRSHVSSQFPPPFKRQ